MPTRFLEETQEASGSSRDFLLRSLLIHYERRGLIVALGLGLGAHDLSSNPGKGEKIIDNGKSVWDKAHFSFKGIT